MKSKNVGQHKRSNDDNEKVNEIITRSWKKGTKRNSPESIMILDVSREKEKRKRRREKINHSKHWADCLFCAIQQKWFRQNPFSYLECLCGIDDAKAKVAFPRRF